MEFAPAHLVDRISIDLSDEQEKRLMRWIDEKKEAIDIARSSFYARHENYLYNWDDFVTYNRKGPWDGAANVHLPLTAIMVKTYHARLYNIFTNETTVQLSGREGTDDDQANMVRRLRDWYLWDYLNGYKGIRGFAREVFYDTATVGFGIGMKDWYSKMRKVIDIEENEMKREMKDLAPQVEELKNKKRKKTKGSFLETDEEMETRVPIKHYRESQKILTFFEGSRLRSIPFENAYFPNYIPESCDLDSPLCVIVETEMSVSDIILKSKRGEWTRERADKVVAEGAATPYHSHSTTRGAKLQKQRENLTGYNSQIVQYDRTPRRLQYAFCTYDIDDDKIDEEIVVTRSEKGNPLKVTFLDRISRSGMRPLFKFDCFQKPRQAYSRGVPEFMYPLNEEMDLTHNMRLNYLALQTCPFGTYRASSSLKKEPIRIAPGKFIPTEETTDMKVLNFQTNATVLGAEEDRLWHYAERLASSSSLSQGIVPQTVGPTRSTSGVLALLQQMDKEFKPMVDACADQWKKMEKMILDDLDFRIKPDVKMKVLGASITEFIDNRYDENKQVDIINDALRVNSLFDVRIDVASVIRSDEVFRSDATQILQILTAPSIAIQLGVVGPKALLKAYSDWLKSYGKDPEDYIDTPSFIGKPLTMYQEVQICGQAQVPPMAMNDKHQDKAQMLQAWLQDPHYLEAKQKGLYAIDTDLWIMKAIEKHLVLAQFMQPGGLPNSQGTNNQDMTQVLAGQAPQQQSGYKTPEPPAERSMGGTKENAGTGRETGKSYGQPGMEGGQ